MKKIKYLGIVFIMILILTGCEKKIQEDELNVILKDNLSFEINSELTLMSLISKDNEVEIISEDETIDTSILGKKELIIKYKDKEEKEYKFSIEIVDTIKPTIEYEKELSTTSGTKIDLLKDVKVTDNSQEEIKATIEGEYDFDKVGTYNLKYVAIDSSNNKTEEDFTLKVNEKPQVTNNTTNNTSNNSQANNNQQTNNKNNDDTYYEILPYGTIVSDYVDTHNTAIITKSANFYYYISKVNKVNDEIVSVEWSLSADKKYAHENCLEQAKAYITSPPNQEKSIKLYKENPDIHWGEKELKYVVATTSP